MSVIGQPFHNEQEAHPHCIHCPEVALYTHYYFGYTELKIQHFMSLSIINSQN